MNLTFDILIVLVSDTLYSFATTLSPSLKVASHPFTGYGAFCIGAFMHNMCAKLKQSI